MNNTEIMKIVEQFSRSAEGDGAAEVVEGQMKVTRVSDSITVYVETIGDIGRSINFNEYNIDGKTYWAGYSLRSDTVFVSQKRQQ